MPRVEPFCTTCPLACRERATRAPRLLHDAASLEDSADAPCLERNYAQSRSPSKGIASCTPACNNVECDYDGGDCSLDEIRTLCVPRQALVQNSLQKAPSQNTTADTATGLSLTPSEMLHQAALAKVFDTKDAAAGNVSASHQVGLQLMVSPLSLTLNQDTNAMTLRTMIEYRVQWSDARLITAPCRGVLPELFSVSEATSAAELLTVEQSKQLMWLPLPSIQGEVKRKIKQTSFVAAESLPWLDSASVPTLLDKTQGSCLDCAVYREKSEVEWSIGSEEFGHYRKFPFDVHRVRLTLSISGADLYSCETALRGPGWSLDQLPSATGEAGIAAWSKFLLPPTHEWVVTGDMSGWHMTHGSGGDDRSVCHLSLSIRRNWLIFFTKQILVTILIVCSGLLSLLVHPQDHTGDRIAHIMVAALIVVVNYQVDLNIGKLQYLIWWDTFTLTQLVFLLIALGETIYVHYLCTRHRENHAVVTDRNMYFTLQFGVYPIFSIALGVMGVTEGDLYPVLILVFGLLLVVSTALTIVLRRKRRRELATTRHLKELRAADTNDAEAYKQALLHTFNDFDIDSNGSLTKNETRKLMRALFPSAEPSQFNSALQSFRTYFEVAEDALSFESFHEGLQGAIELLGEDPASKLRRQKSWVSPALPLKMRMSFNQKQKVAAS